MTLAFKKIHPGFAAEVSSIDLRQVEDKATLAQIRAAMDEHAVLVFHNQSFTNDDQLRFAERLDGKVNMNSPTAVILGKSRLDFEGMIDVSNLNKDGEIWGAQDRKRLRRMTNYFWHTDASFLDPPGHYSMLWAKAVPPVSAPTEFADMRAAYDALDVEMKEKLEGVLVQHSALYNKQLLGFELAPEEAKQLDGAVHSLVRANPRTHRRSLYLAIHASHIVGWPVPEGRLMLHELTEHATQRQFVYRHEWQAGDLVIWDNLATMHRGRPYNDMKYRRELVRVTTLDSQPTVA